MKATDEYQFGVPEDSIEEYMTLTVDISQFDITDKKGKKEAVGKIESAVSRFQKKQRKLLNKVWSQPHIDLKTGTAIVVYCKVGQFCVEEFESMGKYFKLDCPITGNYCYGDNWYDTH